MNTEENLKNQMTEKSGSVKAFSESIGLPYTTVRSILERGVMNAKMENILKICKGLGIKPESLTENQSNTLNDIYDISAKLETSRQQNVYSFAKGQLADQQASNVTEIPSIAKTPEPKLKAAHIDDDASPEERRALSDWIDGLDE